MKRLVIVAAAMSLALFVSCALAVLVSRRTVANSGPAIVDMCSGLPCFIGVTPGRTLMRDVRKLIGREPIQLVAYNYNGTSVQFTDGTRLDMFSNNVGKVDAIYVNPANGALSVLDVVSTLGAPPCGVQLGPPDNQVIILFYPNAALIVGLDDNRLDMRAKVVYMEMLNASHSNNCDRSLAPGEPHTPWQGFASMDRYAESLPR